MLTGQSRSLSRLQHIALALAVLMLAACGGGGGSGISSSSVNGNQAPIAASSVIYTKKDTSFSGKLGATDPDGDNLTYRIATTATMGQLAIIDKSTGEFTYQPNPGMDGTDSFTFIVNDGQHDSNVAPVTIHIVPPDIPAADNDLYGVTEGGSLAVTTGGVLTNDIDPGSKSLTAVLLSDVSHGTLSLNSDGTFSYTHDGSKNFTDSFTYHAFNGTQYSNIATVTITITPVVPTANDDSYNNVDEAGTLAVTTGGILGNDSDPNGKALTAVLLSDVSHGTLSLNPNGTFSYTHDGSKNFTDSFTYHAFNGTQYSNIATVTITITPVVPTANDDSYNNVDEAGTLAVTTGGVLGNDSDPNGKALTAVLIGGVSHGTLSLNTDGTFSYTHDGTENFTDSFTYQAFNGAKYSNTATATITITPVNDPPIADAGPDQYVVENSTVNLAGIGTDAEGSVNLLWEQIAGTPATLSDPTVPNPSFVAPAVSARTTLTFRLTVTDLNNVARSDTVDIHIADILFTDDFNDGNANGWVTVDETSNSSSWSVISGEYTQSNKVESATAFDQSYHLGTFAYLQSGTGFTDYKFNVQEQFLGNELHFDEGVMFRYQDPNNYYRLSFNSRFGYTRLEKKVGGIFSTLAMNSRGYKDGELLNITVNLDGSKIQIYLNGDPLFAVSDSSLSMGTVALYCAGYTRFDNVIIRSPDAAPKAVLSTPDAYSVNTTDMMLASAIATNVPAGGEVEFLVDGVTSIIDNTPPYNTLLQGLSKGNHTIEAILRNQSGVELDRDTNVVIGAQGNQDIAIGDSITNGDGDTYSTDNILQDGLIISAQGYEANLTELLNTSFGYPNIVINEGIGGDESADAAFLRINSILTRHPNANKMLILIGTNDANTAIPSGLGCSGTACNGTYKGNMQSLINTITTTGKEAWVALAPPVFGTYNGTPFSDPATASANTNYIQKYNQVISTELANRQIGPDFYTYFLGGGSNRFSLFHDNLHPNSLGHMIMSYLWFNAMNPSNTLPIPFILDGLTPSTVSPFLKQNLIEPGDKYYVDETFTLTGNIPAELSGGRWIMTANADKSNNTTNYVSFNVDRPVTMFIAYDAGATQLPNWMSGYSNTGLTLQTTDPLSPTLNIYSAYYTAGSVVLGGNLASGASGADSNYIAIVVAN